MPFLLQQAAWLYEHQLSTVRAQMRQISGSRPTSLVGGADLSQDGQRATASGRSGSGSGSGSGSSVTQSRTRGRDEAGGRPSFTGTQSKLAQVRTSLHTISRQSPLPEHSDTMVPSTTTTQSAELATDIVSSSARSPQNGDEAIVADKTTAYTLARKGKLFSPAVE
jgi:hypothetical protein